MIKYKKKYFPPTVLKIILLQTWQDIVSHSNLSFLKFHLF